MRAYVVQEPGRGADPWKQAERPQPRPGHGEVLVAVRACSLNFRDLMIARGQYGPGIKKDLVPLSDGAGEIVELGPGVAGLKKGDRVALKASAIVRVPEHLSFEEVAALPCAAVTAWNDRAPDALRKLESGAHFGKIVVRVGRA